MFDSQSNLRTEDLEGGQHAPSQLRARCGVNQSLLTVTTLTLVAMVRARARETKMMIMIQR